MNDNGNNLPVADLDKPALRPELASPEFPAPAPDPATELLGPVSISLRVQRANDAGRDRPVMAALTTDAVWLQDVWQSRRVRLTDLDRAEINSGGLELALTPRPEVSDATVRLTFAGALEARP